jgi:hypothetical protein
LGGSTDPILAPLAWAQVLTAITDVDVAVAVVDGRVVATTLGTGIVIYAPLVAPEGYPDWRSVVAASDDGIVAWASVLVGTLLDAVAATGVIATGVIPTLRIGITSEGVTLLLDDATTNVAETFVAATECSGEVEAVVEVKHLTDALGVLPAGASVLIEIRGAGAPLILRCDAVAFVAAVVVRDVVEA